MEVKSRKSWTTQRLKRAEKHHCLYKNVRAIYDLLASYWILKLCKAKVHDKGSLKVKGTLMPKKRKYGPEKPSSLETFHTVMKKISWRFHIKTPFPFLRYAHVRYVKSLFTNIQKQKISQLFKNITNFMDK